MLIWDYRRSVVVMKNNIGYLCVTEGQLQTARKLSHRIIGRMYLSIKIPYNLLIDQDLRLTIRLGDTKIWVK